MSFFSARVHAYRMLRSQALTEEIDRLSAKLMHMDRASDEANAVSQRRAQLFWKRNDLYLKMYPTKE